MEELKEKLLKRLLDIDLKEKDIFYVKAYMEVVTQLNYLYRPDPYDKLVEMIHNDSKQKGSESKEEVQNG